MAKIVNILGQDYAILVMPRESNRGLEEANAYVDYTVKTITMCDMQDDKDNPLVLKDMNKFKHKVLRHELIHAFLLESGLGTESDWAENEEMVDFFAMQFPKICEAFKKVGCL